MWKTDYAGIDYSRGQSNYDPETGIAYGIIAQNSVMPEALDDVMFNGEDLGFESFRQQVKEELQSAVTSVLGTYSSAECSDEEAQEIYDMFDEELGEGYSMGESGPWEYTEGNLTVRLDETNLWVFKSAYYTKAQYCSPCMPGAGNLDTSCEDGPKAYCLGADWFEDGKAPYPIYRVDNDELVYVPE